MKRIAAVVVFAVSTAVPAAAADVEVSELLSAPASFAGLEITVEGELVGDFMRRGDVVWVQVNGDPYATAPLHAGGPLAGTNQGIAARFDAATFDAAGFEEPGGYRVTGALVEVTGIWRYHDPNRSGESYLDVVDVTVVQRERRSSEDLPWGILIAGLVLVVLGVAPRVLERLRA
jgi:opacity protein-like surface antigen